MSSQDHPYLCLNIHSSLPFPVFIHSFQPFQLIFHSLQYSTVYNLLYGGFFKSWYFFFLQDQKDEPDLVPGPPEWTDQNSLQNLVAKPFMSKVNFLVFLMSNVPSFHCFIFRCSWTARQQETLLQRFVGWRMGWGSKRTLHRDQTISTITR